MQHLAIGLNAIQVCEPAPCHPLFSDANTHTVVDAVEVALKTIQATPEGWRATANAALEAISTRLDAAGKTKLRAYLDAAREILKQIPGV